MSFIYLKLYKERDGHGGDKIVAKFEQEGGGVGAKNIRTNAPFMVLAIDKLESLDFVPIDELWDVLFKRSSTAEPMHQFNINLNYDDLPLDELMDAITRRVERVATESRF